MRGKGIPIVIKGLTKGITPAYAGKSRSSHYRTGKHKDHPRLCGEKSVICLCHFCKIGSPPPMRGKAKSGDCDRIEGRITPAYAGKSLTVGVPWIHDEDHPRLCGEKEKKTKRNATIKGSPPPMRGKGLCPRSRSHASGITPAYAGKSFPETGSNTLHKDHPRLCGEKRRHARLLVCGWGSPPPMRGKVRHFAGK